MGNKQKTSEITNDLIYLLCPGCFTRVPIIDIVFDNCVPKIKLTCTCEESKSRPDLMDISDYINKMRYRDPLLLKCDKHPENSPVTFCLNCEKWYCEECLNTEHTKKNVFLLKIVVINAINILIYRIHQYVKSVPKFYVRNVLKHMFNFGKSKQEIQLKLEKNIGL